MASKTRRRRKQSGGGSFHCYTQRRPCTDQPILTQEYTVKEPIITLPPGIQYPALLIMFDNDVPAYSKPGYLHWLRIYDSKNSYRDIMPYAKPTPPPGTGRQNSQGIWFHEYIFQLYQNITHPIPTIQTRGKFNIHALKNTLGTPISEDKFRVNA
jgi:hypothetical protein